MGKYNASNYFEKSHLDCRPYESQRWNWSQNSQAPTRVRVEAKMRRILIGDKWNLHRLMNVVPWSLKEFLVYNINAGFCFDGKVDVDSDADGICDRDEMTMNNLYAEELKQEGKSFDPTNRFHRIL